MSRLPLNSPSVYQFLDTKQLEPILELDDHWKNVTLTWDLNFFIPGGGGGVHLQVDW